MRSRATVALVLIALFNTASSSAARSSQGSNDWLDMPVAVVQALDKVTARTTVMGLGVNSEGRYGTLRFKVRTCQRRPPTETPESAAFIEIVDVRPDTGTTELFSGWMFASSPALNALEHPVYDIWLLDCSVAADQPAAPE
ncbi:MAG: DUF2155 domain-containing protein [Alphaproteobacteria bacterium]|nr:DUF2155 domain-containing protein [Alphaproteobacteria bacterium]